MRYSEIIKDIILERNLNQTEMGKLLNVNQTTISQWLKGKKKPGYENIFAIYKVFGISPNELFNIDEDR